MGNWQLQLGILVFDAIIMSAGYCMLIPFLPMYLLKELHVNPAHVSLWSGAVFSVTFLLGGLMAPIWGKLADKKSRKLMMVRSGLGLALSYALGGMVTTPFQLFLVRTLQGFAAGLISVLLAMTSSVVPKEKLGIGMGLFQSGLTIGNVMGPLIGGTLATWFGMRASFFVASGFLLLLTALTWYFIPEPIHERKNIQEQQVEVWKSPRVREILCFQFVVFMVILFVQPILSLYVASMVPPEANVVLLSGMMFSMVGIASALTAPLWGKWGQMVGFVKVMIVCAFCAGVVNFFVGIPQNIYGFGIMNFIFGCFFSGVAPSLSSMLASVTKPEERGLAYGLMFSAQQYGSMLGPLIGGTFVTIFPMRYIFLLSAVVLLSLSITAYSMHRNDGSI